MLARFHYFHFYSRIAHFFNTPTRVSSAMCVVMTRGDKLLNTSLDINKKQIYVSKTTGIFIHFACFHLGM